MVRIAIAGSSGEVAREIIDALCATSNHDLILLSRKDGSNFLIADRAIWRKVDYASVASLSEALHGVHTVLSFITPQTDQDNQAQKNLIDASLLVGVKRLAPSEWATSRFENMPWYSGKDVIREYLRAINKDSKVLEYSLFQPGLFLNYLTHPYKSAKHVRTFETQIDFQNRRAIVPESYGADKITLTTVQDLASIVVKAIEYEGEWPVNGGIRGYEMPVADIIRLGEEIRGGTFLVDSLALNDLEAGDVKSSWLPKVYHPAIDPEEAEQMAGMFLMGMTLGISAGALTVSNEWNKIFSDYEFTRPHEFLSNAWKGKS